MSLKKQRKNRKRMVYIVFIGIVAIINVWIARALSGQNMATAEPVILAEAITMEMDVEEAVRAVMQQIDRLAVESRSFYYDVLSEEVKAKITGISYPDTEENAAIGYEELAYVHVLHYDFNGEVKDGELICNRAIAQDLLEIFQELYENRYPIEKICLIDAYEGDDEASMADNNTSCFNYRVVAGTNRLSKHSYGMAIDINPLYNPYVTKQNGKTVVSPAAGSAYADRSVDFAYKIDEHDLCYRLFLEHGFRWGGAWNSSKDYQHFEKVIE